MTDELDKIKAMNASVMIAGMDSKEAIQDFHEHILIGIPPKVYCNDCDYWSENIFSYVDHKAHCTKRTGKFTDTPVTRKYECYNCLIQNKNNDCEHYKSYLVASKERSKKERSWIVKMLDFMLSFGRVKSSLNAINAGVVLVMLII
jgi:hypothetical protein